MPVYNTDEKACLSPQKKELTLAQAKGLEVRIRTTLEALYISVANDRGLTDNPKKLFGVHRHAGAGGVHRLSQKQPLPELFGVRARHLG
ncbi:hypothetical protein BCU41_025925 [Vibrio lentus]|uniref:hypothetical protein n=1 Tax=Vibrio lentus TaxID=136468 RepID=UPI0039A53C5E